MNDTFPNNILVVHFGVRRSCANRIWILTHPLPRPLENWQGPLWKTKFSLKGEKFLDHTLELKLIKMIHCLPILSSFIYTCICKNSLCMVCRLHDLCIICGSCKLCRSLILHPIFYRFFLYSLKNQIHVIKFDSQYATGKTSLLETVLRNHRGSTFG